MPRLLAPLFLLAALLGLALGSCSGEESAPTATPDPTVAFGENVFRQNCATCHATVPESVIVGPSLAGVASRAPSRMAGLTAVQYIELSILKPDAYIVEGFPDAMPKDLGKKLTGEQLDAVVAYLLTLK